MPKVILMDGPLMCGNRSEAERQRRLDMSRLAMVNLMDAGFTVINLVTMTDELDKVPGQYSGVTDKMLKDMLGIADALFFIPGYQFSFGCSKRKADAVELGLPVFDSVKVCIETLSDNTVDNSSDT